MAVRKPGFVRMVVVLLLFLFPAFLGAQIQENGPDTYLSKIKFSGPEVIIDGTNLFNFTSDWHHSESVLQLRFPRAKFNHLRMYLPSLAEREYIKDILVRRDTVRAFQSKTIAVEIYAHEKYPFSASISPEGDRLVITFRDSQEAEQSVLQTDEQLLPKEGFAVIKLKWANAKAVAEILRGFIDYGSRMIQVDERMNRLILTAEHESFEQAVRLIRRLDTPGKQVLISARIVEINVNAAEHLGLSLGSSVSTVFKEEADSYQGIGLELQPILRSPLEIRATLDMLSEEGQAQVLASPKVATVDGVPAEVKTEERFPVFIRETSGDQTYKVKQDIVAGISLSITPRCGEGDELTTEIHTEVTSITGTTSEGYPTTSTREVETTIRARSGRSIVIGGLIEKREIEYKDKIPFLGDIPVLGRAFTNLRTKDKTTNLWVVVTPYLIGEE
jgi:type II secretory pathway component GspD/PulD (secretin)